MWQPCDIHFFCSFGYYKSGTGIEVLIKTSPQQGDLETFKGAQTPLSHPFAATALNESKLKILVLSKSKAKNF